MRGAIERDKMTSTHKPKRALVAYCALADRLQKPNAGLMEALLIRPDEVLSRIANVAVLEVAHHALGVLLQHRHVFVGRLA